MKNKKNKSLFNLPKILPLIIFFLLILNVPTNKTFACAFTEDCDPCQKCSWTLCVNNDEDTRCSTMCERGVCAKQCEGTCKSVCEVENGETPGDPINDGECFENRQLSPSLHCCMPSGTTQVENCSGTCKNICNYTTETQDSTGTCLGSKKCCIAKVNDDTDTDIVDIGGLIEDTEINTGLTAQSNATQGVLFTGVSCIESGNCSVTDMMNTAINVTTFLLGIIGSVALLFFILAGFKLLTSRGNEQAISSGKQMMVQTVIGIFIFFSAFLIIDFTRKSLLEPRYATPLGNPYEAPGTQEVAVPEATEETTEATTINAEADCNDTTTGKIHWRCVGRFGAGSRCRQLTSGASDLVSDGKCTRAGLCPVQGSASLVVYCCKSDVTSGTVYNGPKTCPCTGNCEY